ncbi:class I SAM-dependent methyltransferase [Lutibacter sp.]|uniref:class I SAM-dependent methyltransferase n=1 Tax=Lutibacter sp. TaxID=1925666 RepID=UPI003569E283
MHCPLCNSKTKLLLNYNKKEYYQCPNCSGISMNPAHFVSELEEITRYKTHNNDVNDIRYQNFVNPIVKSVLSDFDASNTGLDFGSGTGPVITKLLRDKAYEMTTYDPFFDNNLSALKTTYNFIVCCEVIEHFHNPLKEFKLLKSLLKPSGKLYCMTDLYKETINFEKWYYKNDDTHVFFYHTNTFAWIKKELDFKKVTVFDRLIVFEN